MWKLAKLKTDEFHNLKSILSNVNFDIDELTQLQKHDAPILVVEKQTKEGEHEVLFSPRTHEGISPLIPALKGFDVIDTQDPGITKDHQLLFGSPQFYDSLVKGI